MSNLSQPWDDPQYMVFLREYYALMRKRSWDLAMVDGNVSEEYALAIFERISLPAVYLQEEFKAWKKTKTLAEEKPKEIRFVEKLPITEEEFNRLPWLSSKFDKAEEYFYLADQKTGELINNSSLPKLRDAFGDKSEVELYGYAVSKYMRSVTRRKK